MLSQNTAISIARLVGVFLLPSVLFVGTAIKFFCFTFVSDQLWRYDSSSMNLINKVPKFQNKKKTWILPPEERVGSIESSGEVLGLRQRKDCNYGKVVKLQPRGESFKGCDPSSDSEMWLRGKPDEQGYFTLTNEKTGELLTAKNKRKFVTGG